MRVTIVGLGLIGGSIGLALRGIDGWLVTGWDQDPEAVAGALARGAIAEAATDIAAAARGADIVLIATPPLAMRQVFTALGPHLRPGAVVTDVASTKSQVVDWAQELLPEHVAFIGGHPLAGSEQSGIAHARADLLRGAVYCLTPADGVPAEAMRSVEALVAATGSRPLRLAPAAHDAALAAVSHLPFLLSAALVAATTGDPRWPAMAPLAATGYRDVTRLGSGDPDMHRDICLSNAAAIRPWLAAMARELATLADRLEDPEHLTAYFHGARDQRNEWLQSREELQTK